MAETNHCTAIQWPSLISLSASCTPLVQTGAAWDCEGLSLSSSQRHAGKAALAGTFEKGREKTRSRVSRHRKSEEARDDQTGPIRKKENIDENFPALEFSFPRKFAGCANADPQR
jgi:hypothetical protein